MDEVLRDVHEVAIRSLGQGAVADYIPGLAGVDPRQFGMAVAMPDGTVHAIGDSDVRTGASSITLPEVGIYRVSFSVPVMEAGQLIVVLDDMELAYTVVGRSTGTTSIGVESLVQTTVANSVLTIRNPPGNNNALTITPLAGGSRPVASTLIIEQLD